MRKTFAIVLAAGLLGVAAVPAAWALKGNSSAVKAVVNQYLDFIITVPQADKKSVIKAVRGLAGLFDFEKLEGPSSVEDLVRKYNRLVADEITAPEQNKEWFQIAKQGIRDLFFASYIQNYRRARITGVGRIEKKDVFVKEVTFSRDAKSAEVVLEDPLGVSTLKLHLKDKNWLIYAVGSDRTQSEP